MNNMFRNRNHQLMSVLSEQSILLFFNLLTVALFSFLDDEIDLNDLPTSPSSLHGTFKTTWVGQAQAESKKKKWNGWLDFLYIFYLHSFKLDCFFHAAVSTALTTLQFLCERTYVRYPRDHLVASTISHFKLTFFSLSPFTPATATLYQESNVLIHCVSNAVH